MYERLEYILGFYMKINYTLDEDHPICNIW